jgi:hypothetical protein
MIQARQMPKGVWKHDAQDGNGDAHLKAWLVGPSETIPLIEGRPGLSRWLADPAPTGARPDICPAHGKAPHVGAP